MPHSLPHILLIGGGQMGGALLRGWLRQGGVRVVVVDPAPCPEAHKEVLWVDSEKKIPTDFNPAVIVLAVKPQIMANVLPAYAAHQNSLFLSIAAGQTLARLAELLGNKGQAFVRAMPNLPASLGKGITGAVANPQITSGQRQIAQTLLQAIGDVVWLENENLLNAVTAVSGSGPAYVFALVEAMAAAGEKLGLSSEMAMSLARQTIIGSGALLESSPEAASALRRAVTSPGGTTAAALEHILREGDGLQSLMDRALAAAATRAEQLAR